MRRIRKILRNEQGATAAFVSVGIFVMLGMVALAVDLGKLVSARTESQRVSDSAALAGAASFIFVADNDPTTQEQYARQWAKEYAAHNEVMGKSVTLRDPADIDVLLTDRKVRVRSLHRDDHGGPITTIFARVFGVDDVNVSSYAAAEASLTSTSVSCLLPIVLPDAWENYGDVEWDPKEGDIYHEPYLEPQFLPDGTPNINPDYLGYMLGSIGDLIVIKPSQGGATDKFGRFQPGFWDLWLPESFSGVPDVRDRILGCPDGADGGYVVGDDMWRESGARQTLAQAFDDLINLPEYSGQYWDGSAVRDANVKDALGNDAIVTGGLRYRNLPLMKPGSYVHTGSGPHFEIAAFIGVWIESVDKGAPGKRNVNAIIVPAIGGGGGENPAGPLVYQIRLVE
jgi:hypothetical protein